ncbi:uncharacterized protein LOC126742298 [Anthonomus grandis grandis]|uniref:uncharacterized protein LOC126742298 n=1 Tax=Anthonomus grandis grandis TaxID=2921223 RepID=UPI0021668B1C|nr:uncharacterized protein LOC126742298 [Anthonomus grandis grandis]
MPNKKPHHNKTHRQHKEKHASKSKIHKRPKEAVGQPPPALSPIQEISKEKLRIDKHACGDFAQPKLETPENPSKENQPDIDGMNNFFREQYTKIRHQSLEKPETSLLDKSKTIFRKEKSFNDALNNDLIRHEVHHKKEKEDQPIDKKKKKHHHHHHHHHHKSRKSEKQPAEDKVKDKEEKKRHKHHHRSKESKSPLLENPLNTRVQEVVFCQLPRNPFKLKNDKDISEIKDLYKRSNREKKKDQVKSMSREEVRRKHERSSDKYRSLEREPEKDRSKKRHSANRKEDFLKEEYITEVSALSPNENHKKRDHSEKKAHRHNQVSPKPTKDDWPKGLSEITLGPYEQYFVFEKEMHSKNCKKHQKPALRPSIEKRHELFHEEAKKLHERAPEIPKETPKVIEEDKIHQIVEGDMKNYFGKIQAMIDTKLDAILQGTKRRSGSTTGDSKPDSRRSSRTKPKEDEDKKKKSRRSKTRMKESEVRKEEKRKRPKSVTKEEIVNEVLKRIQEQPKQTSPESRKLKTSSELGANEAKSRSSKKVTEKPTLDLPLATKPKSRSRPSSDKQPLIRDAHENDHLRHKKEIRQFKEDQDWVRRLRLAKKELKPRDSLECIRHKTPLPYSRKQRKEPFRFSAPQPEDASCRSFSEQYINEHTYGLVCSASEETIRGNKKYKLTKQPLRQTASPCRNKSTKNLFKKKSSAFLEEIFLPPEAFRPETHVLYRNPQDFIVQGIEPPMQDCIRPKSRKKPPAVRKLECKTVSIVAIQPQLNIKELPVVTQTQTSSKSGKSSATEKDLVQKRMQSKRFKSYYKYSDMHDDSSEAKSIISDSCKIVSDPSEEVFRKRQHGENCQVLPGGGGNKKWNRVSTPRDSHLNNILEEPSNVCITNEEHDYFVPLKGTREFYHRALASSHSDYCFRIDKKPAHSKISIQSGDLEDMPYIRYGKKQRGSINQFKSFPQHFEAPNPKSKSDVLLRDHQAKEVIRYIFLDDKNSHMKGLFKRESLFKTLLNEKDFCPKITKEIQTVQTREAEVLAKGVKSAQQQKQFEEIYRTIDDLEGNILNSLGVKKADAATSAANLRDRSISRPSSKAKELEKKPKMVDHCTEAVTDKKLNREDKTKDLTLEIKHVKMVDAATGNSPPLTPRLNRDEHTSTKVQNVVIANNVDSSLKKHRKGSVKCKIPKPQSKDHSHRSLSFKKSTGVSPIRVFGEEEAIQVNLSLTPRTLKAPQTTKKLSEQKKSNLTPEQSPNRIPISKLTKTRPKEPNFPVRKQKPKEPCSLKPVNKIQHAVRTFRSRNMVPMSGNNALKHKSPARSANRERSPTPKRTEETSTDKNVCQPCIHVADSPKRAKAEPKTSIEPINDPLNINVTAYNCQPTLQINLVQAEESLTSSVSDGVPRHNRRSKSLVDLRTQELVLEGSKSEIFCCTQATTCNRTMTNGSSLLSTNNMEKFTNVPMFRYPRTNKDRFTAARIYGSTLFVTKDYKNQDMSAYERRKRYDQDIRKKKKRIADKPLDVKPTGGPQTFEVRFLSMEGPQQIETDSPIINISLGGNAIYQSQDINSYSRPEEFDIEKELLGMLNVGEQDLLFDQHLKADKLLSLVHNDEKIVTQIYPPENLDKPSNLLAAQKSIKRHMGFCLDAFCDDSTERSDFSSSNNLHLPDDISSSNNNSLQSGNGFKTSMDLISAEALNCLSKLPILTQPLSCPTFPTGSPSFAYLYEESGSEINDSYNNQNTLKDLVKPFNQQSFRFNANQYNVETPFHQKDDIESSFTESVESGYASVKSRNCKPHSLTNFFKRPNIAALLKPPSSSLKRTFSGHGVSKQTNYDEMTKRCQLYAKKVRESSEMKLNDNKEQYQEISLQMLLGKSSSIILERQTLSFKSIDDSPNSKDSEINDTEKDIADDKQEVDKTESFSSKGCKLVLSNHSLKLKSTTYLGPEFFPTKLVDTGSFMALHKKTLESSQDINKSNLILDDDSTNPFLTKSESDDLSTKNFFSLLAKIFEKELEICNKLYKDKEFNELLAQTIRKCKNERRKTERCFGFFKRKLSGKRDEESALKLKVKLEEKASERLQTLASNTRKCFTMLAEAVAINKNMDNNVIICGLLKLLERIENGQFEVVQNDDHLNLEEEIRSEILESYKILYEMCKKEAKKHKRRLSDNDLALLKSFVIKHRIALLTQTDIIISYISRGLICTENQLKAAVTFLTRSISSDINVKDFEAYCLSQ